MEKDTLKNLSVRELLITHAAILEELKQRKIIRTKNNPVGDYAEWLVSTMMGYELQTNSNSGFDAKGPDGIRYQIKARYITPNNPSKQLGVIRNLSDENFDQLVAVLFDKDYSVSYAAMIPHGIIKEYASYQERVNGHMLHLRGKLLEDEKVIDITDRLKT